MEQQSHWDKTYDNKGFFGEDPSELALDVIDMLRENKVKTLLELGCGQGRDTWYFVKEGFKLIALDYSDTGICQMRDRAEAEGKISVVDLMVHDVRKGIPLPNNSVDAVYSHMLLCMELTDDEVQSILDECLRVLKPGGLNIYSVRNDHDPHYGKFEKKGKDTWENPMGFVVHFFSEEQLKELSKGYEVVRIKEFDDESPPFVKKLYEVILRKPKS